MGKHPVFIELGDKAPGQEAEDATHPSAEHELGGGDICSTEETQSTDDDNPLD